MNKENNVCVVVDSGSSMRESSPEVKEREISILPLEVKFLENGTWVPYLDSELSADEFYNKMAESKILPQTSGAVTGRASKLYESLAKESDSIISIHITAKHSVAHESALLAANLVMEANPEVVIEVIDSKIVSIGTWFLAEKAALLSAEGYPLEDIKRLLLETVPKIDLITFLPSLNNLIKGGRVPALKGMIGNLLNIKPIIGFVDGQIRELSKTRTISKAKQELVSRFIGIKEEVVKLAILHTNNEEGARELQTDLASYYPGTIPVYEAGPVLGVHAGSGAVGIALLKK